MRGSRLLRRPVHTASGEPLGVVHDVRLHLTGELLEVTGVVVGADTWRLRAAHACGVAQGRTTGPAPLRALLHLRPGQTLRVDTRHVLSWDEAGALVVADHLGMAGRR